MFKSHNNKLIMLTILVVKLDVSLIILKDDVTVTIYSLFGIMKEQS